MIDYGVFSEKIMNKIVAIINNVDKPHLLTNHELCKLIVNNFDIFGDIKNNDFESYFEFKNCKYFVSIKFIGEGVYIFLNSSNFNTMPIFINGYSFSCNEIYVFKLNFNNKIQHCGKFLGCEYHGIIRESCNL